MVDDAINLIPSEGEPVWPDCVDTLRRMASCRLPRVIGQRIEIGVVAERS
jgi:hypothetical protein